MISFFGCRINIDALARLLGEGQWQIKEGERKV